jgi:Tfx family DNA-binding protein
MVDISRTHFTKRQFEVLRMRRAGKSLSEIAKELRTSRSNISSIAKTAEDNVERARNTLKLIETLDWPIKIEVKAGANVYEISEKIFREADARKIKVTHNYSEIVRLITEDLGGKNIKQRKALKDFSVMVSGDGRIEIF